VATDLLARKDAKSVGILGSGRQARTQLQAVAAVRKLERVTAFSPNRARLQNFCDEMTEKIACQVLPAEKPEQVADGDIIVTATTSKQPVLLGEWLQAGSHINAIGANALDRSELDGEVFKRCALIAVDNRDQAKQEAAELVGAVAAGILEWDQVVEIGAVAAGRIAGRQDGRAITLFKSLGVAMEDVALASTVYERAVQQGVGLEVPLTED
jgi:alanine dehydrogenase